MKKVLSATYWAAVSIALSAMPVWGQASDPPTGKDIYIQPGTEFQALTTVTVPLIISGFVKIVLIIAALIFFFMLVIGGIQWMTSGGDKAATEGARGKITAALVGLIIVFAAYAIITLINNFFGVNILGGFTIPKFTP